jgi:SAM-dependent methyltransferase
MMNDADERLGVMKVKKHMAAILASSGMLFRWLPGRFCVSAIAALAWLLAAGRGPKAGLKLLLQLNNKIYALTGKLACDYDNGTHPKHRLMRYHDFFVDRLARDDTVIDIGCGNGALSYDMAEKAGAAVTGIELSERNYREAIERFSHPNVRYVRGDVLKEVPDQSFDVAVMSNVLEHLPNRIKFLKSAQERLKSKRWLIRVPLYERDWRVPLMDELGVDYRLDSTHYIEYTQKRFAREMEQAGFLIVHREIQWGEIWVEVRPKKGAP